MIVKYTLIIDITLKLQIIFQFQNITDFHYIVELTHRHHDLIFIATHDAKREVGRN